MFLFIILYVRLFVFKKLLVILGMILLLWVFMIFMGVFIMKQNIKLVREDEAGRVRTFCS